MVWHWGDVCVSQLRLTADNVLEVVNGDGESYGAFRAGTITATSAMTIAGKRALAEGQNGTLPDNGPRWIDDLNHPPMGWCVYTQEKTANRPSAYGQVFTSSLTGKAIPGDGNWVMQRAFTTDNEVFTRVAITDSDWSVWQKLYHSGNLPALGDKYLPLAGGSVSGILQVAGSAGAIGSEGGGRPAIEILSSGAGDSAAYMTFHRPGVYAAHFGLDANNEFCVGGYSMGANAYRIFHAGNFNPDNKISGSGGIQLHWVGRGGQPPWLFGGDDPGTVGLYNPSNFHVRYADNA
ncbi:MAG: hypothetical protein NWQ13_01045, partial [Glaciimonas sp.]|nr:hypothetical protein [Glaciimonas sp.]